MHQYNHERENQISASFTITVMLHIILCILYGLCINYLIHLLNIYHFIIYFTMCIYIVISAIFMMYFRFRPQDKHNDFLKLILIIDSIFIYYMFGAMLIYNNSINQ